MQRARILDAMARVVGECGYAGASVTSVVERAGVSRRTFYEQFDDLEDCFRAVLDDGAETVIGIVSDACSDGETWLDGLRSALAALLVFFESERLLARVWLVESMAAGRWALEHRERRLRDLLLVIVRAWPLPDSFQPRPLVVEGVFASVRSIVVQRLIAADDHAGSSLLELLGPLMGLIAAPFLDNDVVELEVARADRLAREIAARAPTGDPLGPSEADRPLALAACRRKPATGTRLPRVLSNPNVHRARLCVLFVADHPGASNTQVAAGIGIVHKGQISRLLTSLERAQLVVKTAGGAGKRNRWSLTPAGESAAATLRCSSEGAKPFTLPLTAVSV